MDAPIRSVLLVTKAEDPRAQALGREVAAHLAERGVECAACEHRTDIDATGCSPSGRPFDMLFVLGGDGTLISVARRMIGLGAPLLGVNLGRLGFLAELAADDWRAAVDDVLAGAYAVTERMVAGFAVLRGGGVAAEGLAVNDLVVSRGVMARLIRLGLSWGGEDMGTHRSDGLILSTPTGSTAYGVSAGGPIVHPELDALCVTPICPFLGGFKPLVLPADRELSVRVEESAGEVHLTEDGQRTLRLMPGDELVVRRHERTVRIVRPFASPYFARLRAKGFLAER